MSSEDANRENLAGEGPLKMSPSELVDAVHEDPSLSPVEKQFSVVGSKAEDELRVYSEIGSANRHLLVNPQTKVTRTRRVDGGIVGVEASIPRSLLSIKGVARSDDNWNAVVSNGGDS